MIRAILFDKDGTLTDFRATWEPWLPGVISELAATAKVPVQAVADGFGFDLTTGTIPSDAPFVTAPGTVTVARLARAIDWEARTLSRWLAPRMDCVEQVTVPGAVAVLARLSAAGLPVGVLTNASVAEATRHLSAMGAAPHVGRVIGYDSGYGAKPDPAGAAAFADDLGFARNEVVLVGDGMTDIVAAREAGLQAVGVLTGTLGHAALAPHTRAVLPDVTGLPDWLVAEGVALPSD